MTPERHKELADLVESMRAAGRDKGADLVAELLAALDAAEADKAEARRWLISGDPESALDALYGHLARIEADR